MSFGKTSSYTRLLLFTAGMGGLLYGTDIGVISAALLYLNKTINLTESQTSLIVAAVLGGSMVSSLIGGLLADRFGRKVMMLASGLIFIASVGIIVISQEFIPLFIGRFLQGIGGGFIGVVAPLYLAECLDANSRGKGTALFQFMITVGIVAASLAGLFYTRNAEAAIALADGGAIAIRAAENHAWRGMFLCVIYPGIVFFLGSFFLSESPRWLFQRGRKSAALAALRRSCSEEEANLELREMESLAASIPGHKSSRDPLLQRKYVIPFVLACVILGCTQATGINSILQFLAVILKQAGMSPELATQGDVALKVINVAMTLVAVALVERRGRKFLLKIGTGGIILALVLCALAFRGFESRRVDVLKPLQAAVSDNSLTLRLGDADFARTAGTQPMCLTVLYTYGAGDKVATVMSNDKDPVLSITPDPHSKNTPALVLERARYGPIPSPVTGWVVLLCLGLFIAAFSVGPGVCVWLALTELLPTRIRSTGMGIAFLFNAGISTAIAAVFLHTVGTYGYCAMFLFWTGCTVVYFVTVTFFLPETKGRTLEEIEGFFTDKTLVVSPERESETDMSRL